MVRTRCVPRTDCCTGATAAAAPRPVHSADIEGWADALDQVTVVIARAQPPTHVDGRIYRGDDVRSIDTPACVIAQIDRIPERRHQRARVPTPAIDWTPSAECDGNRSRSDAEVLHHEIPEVSRNLLTLVRHFIRLRTLRRFGEIPHDVVRVLDVG